MKKQTAVLLSTLVLFSAVSMQPAHAFKLNFWEKKAEVAATQTVKKECKCKGKCKCHKHKFWQKKAKPVAAVPTKATEAVKPVANVKPVAAPAVKAPAKPACTCTKVPAKTVAAPAVKPACPCAKKAPLKK